jgi:hypothetical protein
VLTDRLAQLLRCADRLTQSFPTQSTDFPAVSLPCSQKPAEYPTLHFPNVQQYSAQCSSTHSVAELTEEIEVVMYCAVWQTAGLEEMCGSVLYSVAGSWSGGDCMMSSFMVCADHQMLLGQSNGGG